MDTCDLLIVGGGINGTAIARDAAGRGLSVILCERDDLASHTSSASTKLIHGGLRYLEYYEFRLVREALIEREVLLRAAPHIIWPLRFVLPYDRGQRPAWMLRLGLFLYDNLGGRELLPGTKSVDLRHSDHADMLEPRLKTGFEYSDCWVEDSRLVALNAVDARERGADIRTRTSVEGVEAGPGGYTATLSDGSRVSARAVINAAGPWVDEVLGLAKPGRNDAGLRLVKGSHIIVPRHFPGDHAYIFQNADNRIVFAIPYEREFTLIGTTDVPFDTDPRDVVISDEEVSYLCEAASEYFQKDIFPADVVSTYSGVRPLYDDKAEDASAVTRDYVLDIDEPSKGHPVLSIYGGKITTSRKLAEHALQKLEPYLPEMGGDWTADAKLPGGNIPADDFAGFVVEAQARHPGVDPLNMHRLCRAYGSRVDTVLADGDLRDLGAGLLACEARYLRDVEFARDADDVLMRRSKLGLHMDAASRESFRTWFENGGLDARKARTA